jgi:proteasome-associated ATPase
MTRRSETGRRRVAQEELESMLEAEAAAAESIETELARLDRARAESAEAGRAEEIRILTKMQGLRRALLVAQRNRNELQSVIERLTAPPLRFATYLETVDVLGRPAAVVSHEGTPRVVSFGEEIAPLAVGDEVLLGDDLNVIVSRSTSIASQCGQTARFERRLPDGRLVLAWREEEVVVRAGASIDAAALRHGDPVRWSPSALLATERVAGAAGEHWFLEKTPDVTFDDIGGLDEQIEKLRSEFVIRFRHADTAALYRAQTRGSVLLKGRPGNGKTMLAKALANWLASLSPDGESRFIAIKPGELGSVWYSQTEANIREVFRVAREFGERNPCSPVVIFMDEFDVFGGPRGESFHRVDDRVTLALAGELDGLKERGNVFVIAATNRAEDLDPCFLRNGRLGDDPIEVPRPNRDAAVAILGKHFPSEIPWADDREEVIDAAVARIYSPNGESEIARVTFRDGQERVVRAADLTNGAALAKVARDAVHRAVRRHVATGDAGVRVADVMESVADELDAQASLLTPRNVGRLVDGLPQDAAAVRVERLRTAETARRHRYLRLHVREEAA